MRTFKYTNSEHFRQLSRKLGQTIIKLAEGKQSFGSFFLDGYSNEIMTHLPYFQQAIWGVPMNKEGTIWEYHQYEQLNQIKNYDFAIIFKHQHGNKDDILIQEAKEYGENKYFIIIQTKDEENIGDIRFSFLTEFMIDNPYLSQSK